MRLAVLMPSYEEGERLLRTLEDLASTIARVDGDVEVTVFVVDDGGRTRLDVGALARAAAPSRVVLARHEVNLGQGAAIETARRLALDPRFVGATPFDAFVTMDADGQHGPEDVLAVAAAVLRGDADVALGERFTRGAEVPLSRRVVLMLARVFERALTGRRLSDAHNGLRAFGPRAVRELRLRQNRMAHATEISLRIKRLRVVEVPVTIRYTDETLAKGQRASGAIAIVTDLFQAFLFGSSR